MSIDNYLLFVGAMLVLCIVPGPDMIYLLTRSIAQGKRAGNAAVLGMSLGGLLHLFAAVVGISTVIATSDVAFTALKWCGSAYLAYLGFQAIFLKSSFNMDRSSVESLSLKRIFKEGFFTNILNPQVAIFKISILPQFIQEEAGNTLTQLIILGVTGGIIGLIFNLLVVFFADSVTQYLRQSDRFSVLLNKVMGVVFIALGIKLLNESL